MQSQLILRPSPTLPLEALHGIVYGMRGVDWQIPIVWNRPAACSGADGSDKCKCARDLRAAQTGNTLGHVLRGDVRMDGDSLVLQLFIADPAIAEGIESGRLTIEPVIWQNMEIPPDATIYPWMLGELGVIEQQGRIEVGDPRAKRIVEGVFKRVGEIWRR